MKRLSTFLLGVIILLSFLVFETEIIKYPINLAQMFTNIKMEPSYIPVKFDKSYATIRSCGRNCDYLKLYYVNETEKLIITSTGHVSWADDPKWNQETNLPGTKYFYQNKGGKQFLFWKDEENQLEFEIEYFGDLNKGELVKIADSIKVR